MHSSIQNLDHLKIPLEDVLEATNHFSDENFIRQGGFGKIYKGKLLRSGEMIDIVASRLDEKFGQGSKEFWTEVSMLSCLKHENLVSIVGFCDEKNEKIVINKYETKGSLDSYLSDPSLTWLQRLQICVDVAGALNYIHYDEKRDFSVIHRNIKSSKILLDDNWEPKLSGFSLSMTNVASQRDRICIADPCGTIGYVDPTYVKTSSVTHKSDMYSFGIVLFEVLFGRKAIINMRDIKLAQLAKSYYEYGRLDDLIDPDLRKQMNQKSFDIFSETAYYCLKDQWAERPNIDQIVVRLVEALNFQREQENLESADSTTSNRWKVNESILSSSLRVFAHLQIPLEDIASATSNFADENFIGHGGFGKLYRGKLLRSGKLIDIVTQRLDGIISGQGVVEFSMEISILSILKHENVVSFLGFCDENGEKIIIYEHAVHGSLDQYLSDPILTWSQRLRICIGVARALNHIHYDVIHCDINSSQVLIDKDWEAKVYGFGLSTVYPESWSHRLLFSHYFDASGCTDAFMTPKYDVYSFGRILLEILSGWKEITGDSGVNQSLAAMANRYHVEKQLDEHNDPNPREQIVSQTLTMFSKIAYKCLNQYMQRPSMDQILKELEDVLELHESKHNDLEPRTNADEGTSSSRLKEDIECLEIRLSDIMRATNNFNPEYLIGKGGYGEVYKADVGHLDFQGISKTAGRGTVAIKRIFNREGQSKQEFFKEVHMLNSCKHQNIVSLLGICTEDPEMILVCEFASNGSLEDCLEKGKLINVTWAQRLSICLDIAKGLKYLHTEFPQKSRIFHRDVKSANILLDGEWNAKISDFGLSKFNPNASTMIFTQIAGTDVYLDPEYMEKGKYKKESDVYSFGIVLFEILSGTLAYNSVYKEGNDKGLATVARRRFNEGTLKELIDPNMMREDEHIFTLNKGPNQDSFDAFSKIAYQCLAETQVRRPTMEIIIRELQNAISLQGKTLVLMKFRLSNIVNATDNFSDKYCMGAGTYGKMYNAVLDHFESNSMPDIEGKNEGQLPNRCINVALKRVFKEPGHGKQGFFAEIGMLTRCKHPNIVSLLGISCEDREMILVYKDAYKGSLNDCLKDTGKVAKLSWVQRIQISLDIAHGLNYLLTRMEDKQMIMHFELSSTNILLDANWKAKITCYWHSNLYPANQEASILNTNSIGGTKVPLDPDYIQMGTLKIEPGTYSFGVILFEILSGRLENDDTYVVENEKRLTSVARRHFEEGTLNEIIDPNMMEVSIFRPNQASLAAFSKIAYQCLAENQAKRPTMQVIIEELQNALDLQNNHKESLKLSLEDIKLATKNFNQDNLFEHGDCWNIYKGVATHTHGHYIIAAKRFNRMFGQGEAEFMTELHVLLKYNHENVIGLVGYCNEEDEKIIVYEFASRGSLDRYLSDDSLTWVMRLKICIDIAIGLEFLHGTVSSPEMLIHRDISSSNILLFDDWKAKITGFGLSLICPTNENVDYVMDNVAGTIGYRDPLHSKTGFLTKESDIFSLGAVLFDILCGKLSSEKLDDEYLYLPFLAQQHYHLGELDKLVFEGIKEQIEPQSLVIFARIAYQCIHQKRESRPTADEVVIQLKKALQLQEDYVNEKWDPTLPTHYKEIIQMSKCPEIYSTMKREELYNIFCKGILIQQDKVFLSVVGNGEINVMVSAAMFSYINSCPYEWKSISESRFNAVMEILDISKLIIKINTRAQFLSPNVVYGVYLVFKFCDSSNFSSKPLYVNLKYRKGHKSLHAYFATWRDEDWMMIELHRFSSQDEDVIFEFLLESFSSYYCGDATVYVEGIEFRAIDKVKHEEIGKLKEVQQVLKSDFKMDQVQQLPTNFEEIYNVCGNYDELFWLGEVDGKKLLVLSAKAALYKFSDVDNFTSKPPAQSRFQEVIEIFPQQVFFINCTIKSQMLSPDMEYVCYLVFKLSENCQGMHCPVKVRDILHQENKEAEFLYFITPEPLNIHDITRVPKQREDGWMEIQLWKFNSAQEFKDDSLSINMKFTSHEGTMSGLIVCGLEFRPL